MKDPFVELLKTLQSVFRLESMRNERYTYPAVQQLKDAVDLYSPTNKHSFITLLKAIRESLPYIEKWRLNFDNLRHALDKLAEVHRMPKIDWDKVLSQANVSSKFQFSALNHSFDNDDFLVWINSKSGNLLKKQDHFEITQSLVDHRDRHGFSQKLNEHLKKHPNFLYDLIMQSDKNFIKVSNTRLILYLTDQQVAKAIIKYIPNFVQKPYEPSQEVRLLVYKFNEILSNGRSISTLLRNKEAKLILDNSIYFQIYQSEEYKNQDAYFPRTAIEEISLNPNL